MTTIKITVAVPALSNVAFGIVEGSGPRAERAARESAREWFDGDASTLETVTLDWTGPVPTENSRALETAVLAQMNAEGRACG